ncbi:MAG: hypothetical protein ACKOOL_07745 [Novosphingobium sp.]
MSNGQAKPDSLWDLDSELMGLQPHEVIGYFERKQADDFFDAIARISDGKGISIRLVPLFDRLTDPADRAEIAERISDNRLQSLFSTMHRHVMSHPVWTHPLLMRIAAGEYDLAQLRRFATLYFGQVKNTRQCVAACLARFDLVGSGRRSQGSLDNAIAELSQLILASLLMDEYGFDHPVPAEAEDAPDVAGCTVRNNLHRETHTELYRSFLDGLSIDRSDQDHPVLRAVAVNVCVQKMVADHRSFSRLEALASVGMGMEWGVPAMFMLVLLGLARGQEGGLFDLRPEHVRIWSAHVEQDVDHGIAMLIASAVNLADTPDIAAMQQATSLLMGSRYAMLSAVYEAVFGEQCPVSTASSGAIVDPCSDERVARLLPQYLDAAGFSDPGQDSSQSFEVVAA